jgi:uncharacterized protein YqgC (DUF456 family)
MGLGTSPHEVVAWFVMPGIAVLHPHLPEASFRCGIVKSAGERSVTSIPNNLWTGLYVVFQCDVQADWLANIFGHRAHGGRGVEDLRLCV